MNIFFVTIRVIGHPDPVELVDILSFTKVFRETKAGNTCRAIKEFQRIATEPRNSAGFLYDGVQALPLT